MSATLRRGLWRRLPLTLFLLVTVGIGAASVTAVFAFVDAVWLRPLPFPEDEELVEVQTVSTRAERNVYGCSFPDAEDLGLGTASFEAIGTFRESRINLVTDDRAATVQVAHVTPGFFEVLGVAPLVGRTLRPADDRPGADARKAVLSHAAWRSFFGGDESVLGRDVRTDMGTFEVVGVMPAGVSYPARTDLWIPLQSHLDIRGLDRSDPGHRSARLFYRSIARLADGVSPEVARLEVASVSDRLSREHPETNAEFTHRVVTLRESEAGGLRTVLWLLSAAVVLVVAACCANVAGLLSVHTASRIGEFGVRSALGAGRRRLVFQLAAEALSVGAVGSGFGLLAAAVALRSAAAPLASLADLPAWVVVSPSPLALGVGFLVSMGAVFLAVLGPSAIVFGVGPRAALHAGARAPLRRGPMQSAFVVAEVALSMTLLVAAALLLSSLGRLQRVETGMDVENVSTVSLTAYRAGNNEDRIRQVTSFYRRLVEELETLPGVVAVGGSDNFPYGSRYSSARHEMQVEVLGESEEARAHRAGALLVDVTPDYFEAVGVPLLSGRAFTEGDTLDAPWVLVLSETAARELFPDRDPLGQSVRVAYEGGGADPWARVVGVVGDVRYGKREAGGGFEIYYPYTQYGLASTTLAIRADGPVPGLEVRIHDAVRSVDPATAVERIESLDVLVADTLWRERLASGMLAASAVIASVLAAVGLYGVLSFGVAGRIREIGVRMALGSTPARVLLEVTRSGLKLVAGGVVLGAFGAAAVVPLLGEILFESTGLVAVLAHALPAFVLVSVGAIACFFPSLRASRVDPVEALRRP